MSISDFDDEDDERITPYSVLVKSMDRVVKIPPTRTHDSPMFEFTMHGKTFSVSAHRLMKGQGWFATEYYATFGKVLRLKKSKWDEFIEHVAGCAEDADGDELEETDAVMAADLLFERICGMESTDDKTELLLGASCNKLVAHNPHNECFLCLPSATITDLLKTEIQINASVGDISQAMDARGYKRKGTHDIKVTGSNTRCWWFKTPKIRERQPQSEVLL